MAPEFSPIHRAPIGGEYYVFRDGVHNLIEIEDADDGEYIRKILKTPEVQRLRRIRQNGLSSLVYPGIETTRFPHALGSFHIAKQIVNSLVARQRGPEEEFPECLRLTDRDCLAFSTAALLHDVGHGPLSHAWEECWAEPRCLHQFHEEMGRRIIASPDTELGALLSSSNAHKGYKDIGADVLRFLRGEHHLDYLLPLLEGNLDVDRLDFIARDTRAAGVTYGFHDLEWIIRSLRFARLPAQYLDGSHPRWVIAIDARKGLTTLVQYLQARANMYQLVYHHKTARAATQMLILLFKRAQLRGKSKAGTCRSKALQQAIRLKTDKQISISDFLKLDDSDIWSTIKGWAEDSSDPILGGLARGLLSRDLFKAFVVKKDVYERLQNVDSPDYGRNLRMLVKTRLHCSDEDAEYYYAFDSTSFDVIGSPQDKPWHDVWIMESGGLGFEFRTLRKYWVDEVRSSEKGDQHLLLVHRAVVDDLAGIVERLSFPADSAKKLSTEIETPPAYRLIAPLGSGGAWKEVYAGVSVHPGSTPDNIVALKRYKAVDDKMAATERDVNAINLLAGPHPNLSTPRLLQHGNGETWILETLWTGSLEDLIKKHGPQRDISKIVDIVEQLFAGLAELHMHKLRHTDVKPDNCGILAMGSQGKRYLLGDFGCVSSLPTQMPTGGLLGTLRTRAPEVIVGTGISLKSDVWSMAATAYALCLKEYPFMPFDAPHHDSADRAEREKQIRSNIGSLIGEHRKKVLSHLPPILSRPLEKCFQEEANRPSAQEAFGLFHSVHNELAALTDPLFNSAWQRAEDIVQQLNAKEPSLWSGSLAGKQEKELQDLVTTHKEFVPEQLRTLLEQFVSKMQQH